MRFYSYYHTYYCGIDLHTSKMYVCITDGAGTVLVHRNVSANPEALARVVEPYREDLVLAVECVFVWYWIADVCAELGVHFVLGHALYMKAIHGGKVKNDRLDSQKIAQLLRAGMLPLAYAYPKDMRSTRDLIRRRIYLARKHAELQGHIQIVRHQQNLPAFEKPIHRASNRRHIGEYFEDPMVAATVEIDSALMDAIHQQILRIDRPLTEQVKCHDPVARQLLQTVPGIGPTLARVILYEIGDIARFPRVGNFISYARLVKCAHESARKRVTGANNKVGNAHLKWAFSEATVLFLRGNSRAQRYHEKLVSKYGKAKALSIIAQKLGRVVYSILKQRSAFDPKRFYQ